MQPTTIEALVIIALVLSPGYVFTQVARRSIAHVPESTDLRFLLTIITVGTFIQAVAFPFWTSSILRYYLNDEILRHEREVFSWAVLVCFVLPLVLGVVVGRLTLRKPVDRALGWVGLGYVDRMPSAWDYVVRQPRGSYVRVHLRDGQGTIAGVFGDQSVASLDPKRADVYLQEAWQIDGDGTFIGALLDSRGVWIAHDAMVYVEFLDRREDTDG